MILLCNNTNYNSSNYQEACPFDFASLTRTNPYLWSAINNFYIEDDDMSKNSLTAGSTVGKVFFPGLFFILWRTPTLKAQLGPTPQA